jgi:O-antigen/teichoic acid export membrane protein
MITPFRGILTQATFYVLALGVSKAISLLMVPIFTHYLSPADYGRLDVLQTLANLLTIVVAMGLADTLYRFAGEAKQDEERRTIAANVTGLSVAMAVSALAVFHLVAPGVASLLPGDITETQVRLILSYIALTGTILVPMAWLRLRDRAGLYLLAMVGWIGVQSALSALFLSLGHGVTGVMAAGLIAHVSAAVCLLGLQIVETGIAIDPARWRALVRFGWPLIPLGMAGFAFGSFDRWILAGTTSTAVMAEYALAAKFGLATLMLVQPFELWWQPRRFRVLGMADGRRHCAQGALAGIALALAAAAAMAIVGPVAIRLLTPEVFHDAARYVPALALIAAIRAATTFCNMGGHATHTTRALMTVDLGAAAVAVAGYLWLIPAHGAWGAIIAAGVAMVVRLAATFLVSQQRLWLPYRTVLSTIPRFFGGSYS